jgi:hypothetical protein
MKITEVTVLALLAQTPALTFAAGTVTGYSRDLAADYRHSNERFNNHPMSLSGPRVAWAEPYALGKLKLLIILPWGTAHEAAELRSRIPAEISLITMADRDKWVNPGAGEAPYEPVPPDGVALNDTASLLLSAGCGYDAILIGKVKWSAIPGAIQEKVLAKVRGGTSLVWISPWDVGEDLRRDLALSGAENPLAEALGATVPLPILPLDVDVEPTAPKSWHPRRIGPPDIRAGKLGGGNVVWLDYQDRAIRPAHAEDRRTIHDVDPWRHYAETVALTPFVPDDDLFYDYYFSILGKALYQATGKTTVVQVRAVRPMVTVERHELPSAPVSFAVGVAGAGLRDGLLRYELRDRQGRVLQQAPPDGLALVGGPSTYAPELPRLPRGTYVVDVWALQRGAVLDWASSALVVTDTTYIEAVQPAKGSFARADPIRGTVRFATPPGKGLTTGVELWDTYGRLIATARVDRESGHFALPPIAHPLSRAYRLVATVAEKGSVVDRAETWVGLPDNTVDDYQFIIWAHAIRTRANRTSLRQYREYGVTGYYDLVTWMQSEQIVESADALARNNLLANPYTCHLGLSITPERKYEDTLRGLADWLDRSIQAYRRYGTMAYSTCEECHILRGEKDWDNPEALGDYRAYLRERYGDIAKLNQVWGTAFGDFTEIGSISFVEAKTSRQPTRWLEQELHKVDRFNRTYEGLYAQIQKGDPGARMSLDCIGGMDFDWPRMARLSCAYTQCPLEAFGKGQGNLVGTWIGYYLNQNDEWVMRTTPWQYLFQGGTHVHWWPGAYGFTADLSEPMLCLRQAAQECRELESGAGKLLLSSRKRIDPILLLWSNTSYYAGILNPGEISWQAARERFENLLRHTGLDYRAVGSEFIETELAYGDAQRVLLLPACQAISRQGVARIRAFAEAGGVVVADFPPAVVDEYLRPYGAQEGSGKIEFVNCARCRGQKRVEVGNVWQACPLCGGTGQTMKGDASPAKSLLEDVFDVSRQGASKVGNGYGLFLKGSPVRSEEWGALRKVLVENSGIRGDIEVQDALGNLRTDLRSYVFDNGRARFVGILPDRALSTPPGEEVTVKLEGRAHAYDVRRQQYLGEAEMLKTGILPAEAKLLAFLPERIAGLNLSLSKAAGRPGDTLELRGALVPPSLEDSRLVVRIELSRGGEIQAAHTRNLAFAGSFVQPIPLALNQAKGEYRVRATEVISGHTHELEFSVR